MPLLLLLLATTVCSLHRFDNALVWDDPVLVDTVMRVMAEGKLGSLLGQGMQDAVHGHARGGGALNLYRPVALWSLALNAAVSGRDPWSYHLLNLLLHLCNVGMLWRLAGGLLGPAHAGARLFGVSLFALGPQLAPAHIWISGRFDLLATSMVLLSLLVWRGRGDLASEGGRPGLARNLGTGACFLAALLCKEPALGCLAGILAWPGLGGARQRLLRCLPFLCATAAYVPMRLLSLSGTGGGHQLEAPRLLQAAGNLPLLWIDGLVGTFVPQRVYPRMLLEDYAGWSMPAIGAAAVLVLGLVAAAVQLRHRAPVVLPGLLWYLGALAPVALVTTDMWPGFGRYLYLPAGLLCVGVAKLLADGGAALATRVPEPARLQRILALASGAYLLVFGVRTAMYVPDFHDDTTLFTSIVTAAPERSHGHGWLGMDAIGRDAYPEAIALLTRALEIAPTQTRYERNLAEALLAVGRRREAAQHAEQALQRSPRELALRLIAAFALMDEAPTRAAEHALQCLRLNPEHPDCRRALGVMRSQHPDAAALRTQIEQRLREPDMREVAAALLRPAKPPPGR